MTAETICTKAEPNREANRHPDAKYVVDEYGSLASGGSYEIYKCPNCGRRFYVQLPD